jgi:hypothetical protein
MKCIGKSDIHLNLPPTNIKPLPSCSVQFLTSFLSFLPNTFFLPVINLTNMSLNVSDSALIDKYEDVRDDKSETNWVFFDFADGKPDRLQVAGSGNGGLAEFVAQLKPEVAGWGYLRMNMSNDE